MVSFLLRVGTFFFLPPESPPIGHAHSVSFTHRGGGGNSVFSIDPICPAKWFATLLLSAIIHRHCFRFNLHLTTCHHLSVHLEYNPERKTGSKILSITGFEVLQFYYNKNIQESTIFVVEKKTQSIIECGELLRSSNQLAFWNTVQKSGRNWQQQQSVHLPRDRPVFWCVTLSHRFGHGEAGYGNQQHCTQTLRPYRSKSSVIGYSHSKRTRARFIAALTQLLATVITSWCLTIETRDARFASYPRPLNLYHTHT